MSDIKELEDRLSAALSRISAALTATASAEPQPDPAQTAEIARLIEALDAEKAATAMLEERVKALSEKQQVLIAGLERDLARVKQELADRDGLMAQLRRVNAQLRTNNLALREANAKGLGDAHLVNKAMLGELESLRASRDADRAEIDTVLAELKPYLEEAPNA